MAAIKPLSSSYQYFARPVPGYVLVRALAASTAESMTPPAGAKYVFLVPSSSPTYVKFDGTATVPGDTTDGTASEQIPPDGQMYYIEGVTAVSVISAGTPVVTGVFYS